jgi:hypothetical protein
LQRLEACLHPDGQAFICLFQLVRHGEPLVCELLVRHLEHRVVELTPSQARPISFAVYCRSYAELFPGAQAEITRWEGDLLGKYGDALMLNHYVAHVGPQTDGPTRYVIQDNFTEKYGDNLLVPAQRQTIVVWTDFREYPGFQWQRSGLALLRPHMPRRGQPSSGGG